MVPGEEERSKDSRDSSALGNKLNAGGQILERIENDSQICSMGNGIGWGRKVENSVWA